MSATLSRERPLLYSGAMVRAILAGEKTQTRRVVRAPIDFVGPGGCNGPHRDDPSCWGWEDGDGEWWKLRPEDRSEHQIACPHGDVGDRLWVREAWAKRADGLVAWKAGPHPFDVKHELCRWRPSIHMPRWASRITLEITAVRVERVRSIGPGDIEAEGIAEFIRSKGLDPAKSSRLAAWIDLWDSTNDADHAWHRNPWTWVVEFRRPGGGAP